MVYLPSDLFISFFRDSIRVLLNWERMQAESWPVTLSVEETASAWYAPWYYDSSGSEVDYRATDAHPILLSEVPHHLNRFRRGRRETILAFSEQFRRQHDPTHLVVPAYSLRGGRYLVLDGNHRISGLVHAGSQFRAMFLAVHGPIVPEALPDLQHWADGS